MLILISQPVRFQVIEKDRVAAFDRLPGIRAATFRVHATVRNTKSRFSIDEDIRRSSGRRTNRGVRATRPAMRILRDVRLIAES